MTFLLGVILGAVSGGLTYALTAEGLLALIIGAVVMILTWLGFAGVIVIDD